MVNLQLPNIKGDNEREQLKQMQRYLYQLVEQLQFALDTVSVSESSSPVKSQMPVRVIQSSPVAMMSLDRGLSEDQVTFQTIKPLIIKSADIINAYYEEINKRLESLYVAQSDFGKFIEQNSQVIESTATDVTQRFNNIQVVITDLDTNIGSVRGDLQAVGEEVSYALKDIDDINENIDVINSQVGEIGGSIYDLNEEIGGVKTNVQAVEQKATDIEGNVQTISSDVETLDTSIADVDKSVQAVDKNLWNLDNKVKDTKTGLDTSLGKLSGDLGKLDSGVKDLKENVDTELKDVKSSLGKISQALIEVNANIKSGLLYYDENEIPVYGLEVGQRNIINGVEVFNKFARFTSDRLSFYDQNSIEVAYISDRKLYIGDVEITISFKMGGLVDTVMANGDVVEKWVGRR